MALVVAQNFWEQVFNFGPRKKPIKKKIRANTQASRAGHRAPSSRSLALARTQAPPRPSPPPPARRRSGLAARLAWLSSGVAPRPRPWPPSPSRPSASPLTASTDPQTGHGRRAARRRAQTRGGTGRRPTPEPLLRRARGRPSAPTPCGPAPLPTEAVHCVQVSILSIVFQFLFSFDFNY
jgi:hypothetical protein